MSDSGETKTDTIYLTAATLAAVAGPRVVRPARKRLTKVAKLNRKLRLRISVRRFSSGW